MKTTIRTVRLSNGDETCTAEIAETDDGRIVLIDETDVNSDGWTELADASDCSVMDVVRDNGWEIVED